MSNFLLYDENERLKAEMEQLYDELQAVKADLELSERNRDELEDAVREFAEGVRPMVPMTTAKFMEKEAVRRLFE